jgi:galactose mutarotase-like enzyme
MTTTSVSNDETDLTISLSCESGEYMYLYALEIYYTLNDTDTPTKIETASANTEKSNIYYNLQGQRVENPSKGIYILNGKKVLIK